MKNNEKNDSTVTLNSLEEAPVRELVRRYLDTLSDGATAQSSKQVSETITVVTKAYQLLERMELMQSKADIVEQLDDAEIEMLHRYINELNL